MGLVAKGEHRVVGGNPGTHDHELGAAGHPGEGARRWCLDELDVEVGGPLAHGLVGAVVDRNHPCAVPHQAPRHGLATDGEADHQHAAAGPCPLWTPPAHHQLTNPRERKSA